MLWKIFNRINLVIYLQIYKSVLITSPTGFGIAFTNVETTLKQRLDKVVSTLCNVENPTSDFVSFSTSDQCYFNVDSQRWNNVDPTLKC